MMIGPMHITKRKLWNVSFLGITSIAIGLEIMAAVKKDPDMKAWTNFVVDNVPRKVAIPAIGMFSSWLVVHFYKYYKKVGK